jgi:predicted AAA+ superfamily ATPase
VPDTPPWSELVSLTRRVLQLAERWLGARGEPAEGELAGDAWAYRWRGGRLEPIAHPDVYPLSGLLGVERSVAQLRANVAAFVRGEPALDALLFGERGTGKSSAVRGLLGEFGAAGLRLIEVLPRDLLELPRLYAPLRKRPERFALFCDDLSFDAGDASYKQLKAVLSGGLERRPDNVLLIATSNRKHLMPETMAENLQAHLDAQGELRPGEAIEEKLSLSDRFGLVLPFFAFDQRTYLRIVEHHAAELGLAGRLPSADLHARALRFALERASRSGRTARQACVTILQELVSPPGPATRA